jgi:protein-disulfide isomerase
MRTYPEPRLKLAVSERDHIRGSATARVTLVEYGDYQCPYCGAAYPIIEAICQALGEQLQFVFRHFPLAEMHPHAMPAAETAEAAAAQHKFWEMHDTLYTHQEALAYNDLVEYARSLGISPDLVQDALVEHPFEERVRSDFMNGVRSGVNGTPTFFIEGVRYDGPMEYDSLLAALQDVIRQKGE